MVNFFISFFHKLYYRIFVWYFLHPPIVDGIFFLFDLIDFIISLLYQVKQCFFIYFWYSCLLFYFLRVTATFVLFLPFPNYIYISLFFLPTILILNALLMPLSQTYLVSMWFFDGCIWTIINIYQMSVGIGMLFGVWLTLVGECSFEPFKYVSCTIFASFHTHIY